MHAAVVTLGFPHQKVCVFARCPTSCLPRSNSLLSVSRSTILYNSVGSIFGFVLSSILLLGLVNSAVNTILVCFAAGPFEFHKNHPRLCQEMRDVWSQQVWEPTV